MLSIPEKVNFMCQVSAFAGLNDEQLHALAEICKERTFQAGASIFQQGEIGGALHIVVSGKVAIERELQRNNDSVSIMIVVPYSYLGEMSLFYDAPRSVTATAMETTITLEMENETFLAFARGYPDLLIEFCRVLSIRLCEAYDKISEVTIDRKPRELRKLYDKLDF